MVTARTVACCTAFCLIHLCIHNPTRAQTLTWCPPPGDTVTIWHVAGPSLSGMPSLPTAIANQMRRRGVAAVHYTTLYSDSGDSADYGRQVGASALG